MPKAGHKIAARLPVGHVRSQGSALRAGELDVMVVTFEIKESDLSCGAVLSTDDRAAVVGAGHPLARRDSVSIEELADLDTFRCPGALPALPALPAYVWDEVVPPVTPAGRPIRRVLDMTSAADMMKLVAGGRAVHISVLSLADVTSRHASCQSSSSITMIDEVGHTFAASRTASCRAAGGVAPATRITTPSWSR